VRKIDLIFHDFDILTNEHSSDVYAANLLNAHMVAVFYDNELWVYTFPKDLMDCEKVDYWPCDGRVKRFVIIFDRVNNPARIDLSQPFIEIITELAEGN
jgi:hypothetical protein